MRSTSLSLPLLLSLCAPACSDDSTTNGGGGMSEAGSGSMAGSDFAGSDSAGSDPAGSGSMAGSGSAGSGSMAGSDPAGTDSGGTDSGGTDSGGTDSGGGGTAGDDTAFSESGVCGARATGVVTREEFQTTEERYLLGDGGFGADICVVRFDVTRIGDAPPGCDESAGQQEQCLWTHLVQYGSPSVVLDENGVCANSELGMDADAIAAIDGRQVAYGYVSEYQGHNSVLMVYDEQQQSWQPGGNAGWDEATGNFLFDERRGFCNYAP